jgi:hypothetical protein
MTSAPVDLAAIDQQLLDSAIAGVLDFASDLLNALDENRSDAAEQYAALLKEELAAGVGDNERAEVITHLKQHIAASANGHSAVIYQMLGLPTEAPNPDGAGVDIRESLIAECIQAAADAQGDTQREALIESSFKSLAYLGPLAVDRWRGKICAAFKLRKRTFDELLEKYQPATDAGDSPTPAPGAAPTQSTLLVELAEKHLTDRFHDSAGTAYGCARIKGHRETMRMRSMAFRAWLGQLFFQQLKKAPGGQALQDAINVLAGKATFDAEERMVYLRIGELNGRLYLDLGDPAWRAVEISAEGWKVVATPPVYFYRARGMGELPAPQPGGSIDELRELINVKDAADFCLVVAWLLVCFRPSGPFPVLDFIGESGTAKSTAARVLKALIDPGDDGARAEPRDVRDLMIAAKNHWVLSYDNLSYMSDWLSDALCRLSTGGGFGTRELYTNDEEIFLSAQRPVILNGIEDVITRGDLLDRAIPITLSVIGERARREERAYWAAFEAARPRVLGALLDAVCMALATVDQVHLDRMPRMADFARWVTAAEPALGWPAGTFMQAYQARQGEANEIVLSAARIFTPLLKVVADAGGNVDMTYAELLLALVAIQPKLKDDKKEPLTAQRLPGELRRIAPNLRRVGLDVRIERPNRRQPRRVVITRVDAGEASPPGEAGLTPSDRPHQQDLFLAGDDIKEPIEADEAGEKPIYSVGYETKQKCESGGESGDVYSEEPIEDIGNGLASADLLASAEAEWLQFGDRWGTP